MAPAEVDTLRASLGGGGAGAAGGLTEAEYIVLKLVELEELDPALLEELRLAFAALDKAGAG